MGRGAQIGERPGLISDPLASVEGVNDAADKAADSAVARSIDVLVAQMRAATAQPFQWFGNSRSAATDETFYTERVPLGSVFEIGQVAGWEGDIGSTVRPGVSVYLNDARSELLIARTAYVAGDATAVDHGGLLTFPALVLSAGQRLVIRLDRVTANAARGVGVTGIMRGPR